MERFVEKVVMKNTNIISSLIKKIRNKEVVISVIGLGYVGFPLCLALVKAGFKVFGIDNDKNKITSIKKGESYISTITNKMIKTSKKSNFFPTSNFKFVLKSNVVIICVPTPIDKNKKPNMEYVSSVVRQIGRYLSKNKIIILECTTYPGTSEEFFLPLFRKKKLRVGADVFLGYSPEREDPGNNKFSIFDGNIPRVVAGYTNNCTILIQTLYKCIVNKVYKVSNIKTAEFTKLLENIYRAVNIGLVNELRNVCSKMGINIYESIKAAQSKPFGFSAFYPGPGVGGHCIPMDPYFLSWKAKKYGVSTKFIKLAGKINDNRPNEIANKINNYFKKKINISNRKKILVLGITYKKNSDDIRESPGIKICNILKQKFKSELVICDPLINVKSKKLFRKFKLINLKKINKRYLKLFKLVLIITNHDIFNYNLILNNSDIIFDCRNSFNKKSKKIIQV